MTLPSQKDFVVAALEAFGFLTEKHGFSAHECQSSMAVEYARSDLRIRVFREFPSFTISVVVVRRDKRLSYSLHTIMRALAPQEKRRAQGSVANTSKMKFGLAQLSDLCRCHLGAVFAMNEEAWERIDSLSKEEGRNYAMDVVYGDTKYRGNLAWESKDWKEALDLYKEAEPALAPYQQRRLRFLAKKLTD